MSGGKTSTMVAPSQLSLFNEEVPPIRWSIAGLQKEMESTGSEAAQRYIGLAIGILKQEEASSATGTNTLELRQDRVKAIEMFLKKAAEVSTADIFEEEDRILVDFSWVVDKSDNIRRKFEINDLENSRELLNAANWYVKAGYPEQVREKNPFVFMDDMVAAYDKNGHLSYGQLKAVLNCMVPAVRFKLKQLTAPSDKQSLNNEEILRSTVEPKVKRGRYTVILGTNENGTEDEITVRLETARQNSRYPRPKGSQIASYLVGPNNEADYQGFATVIGDKIDLWPRTTWDSRPVQALDFLLRGGLDAAREAGARYALASENCYVCNRPLTVKDSILAGIGPICAQNGY